MESASSRRTSPSPISSPRDISSDSEDTTESPQPRPHSLLSAQAQAQLDSVIHDLPRKIRQPTLDWLERGQRPTTDRWPVDLVSVFARRGLTQLAVETVNITAAEHLTVDAGSGADVLENMREIMRACPALTTLRVVGGNPSDELLRFLETDTKVTILKLESTDDLSIAPIVTALQSNRGVEEIHIDCDSLNRSASALAATLRANCTIHTLSIREEVDFGLGQEPLESLSDGIAKNTSVVDLHLSIDFKVDTKPLVDALKCRRPMQSLSLEADSGGLIPIVDAIASGDLRVESLKLHENTSWSGDGPAILVSRLHKMIGSSTGVAKLFLTIDWLRVPKFVHSLADHVASTRLSTLVIASFSKARSDRRLADSQALLVAVRKNYCLLEFEIEELDPQVEEEIKQVLARNARMSGARAGAIGQALANKLPHQPPIPGDAGILIASHLPLADLHMLPLVSHTLHQGSLEGQLLALVQTGDFAGITELCRKWADLKLELDKSVLDRVVYAATQSQTQAGNYAEAASMAKKVLNAITAERRGRDGPPWYMPAQDPTLAELVTLAVTVEDEELKDLVQKLWDLAESEKAAAQG